MRLVVLFLIFLPVLSANAQELRPLTLNPALQEASPAAANRMKRSEADTLTLPFTDDYSYEGPYPDDSLWLDNKAYINTSMAIDPPTYGVATLDGLDARGRPYNPDKDNRNNSRPTDTLTSTWIDLEAENPDADPVFFSFWYQEKGIGDAPAPVDSLAVQFKTKADTPRWRTVFTRKGSGERPVEGQAEGTVLINLASLDSTAQFYHSGFQFRFLTYGNVSGNLDHWHLDYVSLARGGRIATDDRGVRRPFNVDAAIVEPPVGLLKEHRVMPWRQVNEEQIRDSFLITAGNASDDSIPARPQYALKEAYTGYQVDNSDANITINVPPFFGTAVSPPQENRFAFDRFTGQDSLKLTFKPAVNLIGDELVSNDTFEFTQHFNHYIAYDDGTPESGFGIENFFRAGQVAQAFQLNQPDTLQAVGIRFNRSLSEVGRKRFDLVIWSNLGPLNTQPTSETVERRLVGKRPRYNGRGRSNYAIYELEKPLVVEGTIYIGWAQTDPFFLNVGVDKNYPELFGDQAPKEKVFFNANGSWEQASNDLLDSGILMIRPYLGGRNEVRYQSREQDQQLASTDQVQLTVFPNPAREQVTVRIDDPGPPLRLKGTLHNQRGRVVKAFSFRGKQEQLNVQNLPAGVYLLKAGPATSQEPAVRKILVR